VPICVEVRDDRPVRLSHAGSRHVITYVVASWVQAAAWWADDADTDPLAGERTYYRVVIDEVVSVEMFCLRGESPSWYVSRIIA